MFSAPTQTALLLAQGKQTPSEIYFWLGVIVALAIVLGFAALWLRKKLISPPDDSTPMGFTLKDLRAMHEAGHLSDEELARAEERALARSRSHYLGTAAVETDPADPDEPTPDTESEPEDVGHLSTDDEEGSADGTENIDDAADKNDDDEPKP